MKAASSHTRQSVPSLSGSAEIVRLAAGCPVHRKPSGATFDRQRQAALRPRPASGRGPQGLRGIRRRSCQMPQVRRQALRLLSAILVGCQFAAGNTNCAVMFKPKHDVGSRCFVTHDERIGGVGLTSSVRNQEGHFALHQRAGLPFRCTPYRAIGPVRQGVFS